MNNGGDKHDILTAELLRKYRDGKLSPDEAIRVETLRQQDPFVADALEGVSVASTGDSFSADVVGLRYRLRKRTRQRRGLAVYSIRVAASLAILLVVSYAVYRYSRPNSQVQTTQVATNRPPSATAERTSTNSPLAQLRPLPPQALADIPTAGQTATLPPPASVQPTPVAAEPLPIADAAPVGLAKKEITNEEATLNQASANVTAKRKAIAALPDRAHNQVDVSPRTRTVGGQVLDEESGTPLPGVNVVVKGTQQGVVTDLEGNYQLELTRDAKTLAFSTIGYATKEKKAISGSRVDVSLETDMQSLSEVVVVGYGDKKHVAPTTTVAQPQSGMRSFRKYLRNRALYPSDLPSGGKRTVKIAFLVQANGSLTDFIVKRSAGNRLDQEAIRLIEEGSDWIPATLQGSPIAQEVVVKVRFR